MIEIKHRSNGTVLYQSETATTVRAAVEEAVWKGVSLSNADLSHANLSHANLSHAHLSHANLSGIRCPVLVPVIKDIDQTILDAVQRQGNALDMSSWHSCETTHCRAGWAIHLAGEAGYKLEKEVGSAVAGLLIYAASGSKPAPDFFASNAVAMQDMQRRARNSKRRAKYAEQKGNR